MPLPVVICCYEHHLAALFDVILIEEECGVAKLDPRIFLAALDLLHVPAQAAWMIGDRLAFDIAVPRQLGMFPIWCNLAGRELPEDTSIYPDWTIHALPEIIDLFSDLLRGKTVWI